MAIVGSSTLAAAAGTTSTTVTRFNIPLGLANTEQSQALPANTKKYVIKSRNNAVLKIANTVTESGTLYTELKANAVLTDDQFYSSQTIYFQSPSTGDTVEIIAYV